MADFERRNMLRSNTFSPGENGIDDRRGVPDTTLALWLIEGQLRAHTPRRPRGTRRHALCCSEPPVTRQRSGHDFHIEDSYAGGQDVRDGRVILQMLTKLGGDGRRMFQCTLKASVSFGESS
jgi:hypothetical protein